MKFLLSASMAALLVAAPLGAETFKWAGTTDPQTMDPHAVNCTPVQGALEQRL